MEIKGWKYYNHAAVPTVRINEEADITPVQDGKIWQISGGGGTPFLASWTTDFDCGYETGWWYIIRESPFNLDNVSSQERKSVRRALKRCYCKRINPSEKTEELYECYASAQRRYKNADNLQTKEHFIKSCNDNLLEWWGGFDIETDALIGYMTVRNYDTYIDVVSSKYSVEFLNKRVSDALNYTVLDYYLNNLKKDFACFGGRSINHQTNVQDYNIKRFDCRKAYCHLNLAYNPKIKWAVRLIYPFRKILTLFDGITLVHQINSVLKMEEIYRNRKKKEKL